MGMFDTIYVDYPLDKFVCDGKVIDPRSEEGFQTKDLENLLTWYRLTTTGRLVEIGSLNDRDHPEIDTEYHGIINFYNSKIVDGQKYWIEYEAKFTDGQLVSLVPEIYVL